MTPRIIVGIVGLVCVSVLGMLSTVAGLQMVEQVNNKLPQDGQFGEFGWYWLKRQRLHREYARLYPSGQLLRKVHIFSGLGLISLLVSAWGFGFFLA